MIVLGVSAGVVGVESSPATREAGVPIRIAPRITRGGSLTSLRSREGASILPAGALPLPMKIINSPGLAQAVQGGLVLPLAIASGDLNEDGEADLVVSYLGPAGGFLTFQRGRHRLAPIRETEPGNEASEKIISAWGQSPFDREAEASMLPLVADLLTVADGDADGHLDVLAAERGTNIVALLRGDGRGRFTDLRRLMLPGRVTAMASGDVNRSDGIADLVVGVVGAGGPLLMVFEGPDGLLTASPEVFPMPDDVSAIAIGHIDDAFPTDIVVGAGANVLLIRGRDRRLSHDSLARASIPEAVVETLPLPARIASADIGILSPDSKGRGKIAVLDGAGTLHIVSASRRRFAVERSFDRDGLYGGPQDFSSSNPGAENKSRVILAPITGLTPNDLILMDSSAGRLVIVSGRAIGDVAFRTADESQRATEPLSPAAQIVGDFVDLLPMRLNGDALSDVVILAKGSPTPWLVMSAARKIFVVSHTGDTGPGSLRQAILEANSSPGPDAIVFNIAAKAVPTIVPQSPLPEITDAVTIDGTTQAGGFVKIDGSAAGITNGLTLSGGNSVVRGLIVTRFRADYGRALSATDLSRLGGSGIVLSRNGGNIVEGCIIGGDLDGASGQGNGLAGILVTGPNNTIGGLSESARNVLVSNVAGLALAGRSATGNLVQGNFIGVDRTGRHAMGNSVGIIIVGATNNAIGGAQAGAGNLLSGNTRTPPPLLPPTLSGGIAIADFAAFRLSFIGASGNLIQGNLVGTDVDGKTPVPNGAAGVAVLSASDNTIGGTTAALGNVISGNSAYGVTLVGGARNLVQGNLIGLAGDERRPLPNRSSGILVSEKATAHLIGGLPPGARNLLAYNGGDAVSLDASAATGNAVRQNGFIGNAGLEVNLMDENETINMPTFNDAKDPDTGPNNLQNYPDLLRATVSPDGTVTLAYRIDSAPTSSAYPLTVEIFASRPDRKEWLLVSRDVYPSDSAQMTRTVVVGKAAVLGLAPGDLLATTATDAVGNTSEFSPPRALAQEQDFSLSCTPSVLAVAPGSSVTTTCTITSSGGFASPVTLSCRDAPAGVTCTFNPNPLTPGPSAPVMSVVSIAAEATASPGTGALQIVGTSGSVSRSASVRLTIGAADLSVVKSASPDPAIVGSDLTYTLAVSNNGPHDATGITVADTLPDTVRLVSVQGGEDSCRAEFPRIICTLSRLTPGRAATITLVVRPTAEGTITNRVSVKGDEVDTTPANDTASVVSRVLAPKIEVSPARLDFGRVLIGQRAEQSFVIRNAGTASLTVTRITVSDPPFSITSPSAPFTLDPGGHQSVVVEFRPEAPGEKSASVMISSTDPARPTTTVDLRGEAVAAVARMEVAPLSLDFGSVLLGHSSERVLTVRNTGTAALVVSAASTSTPQFAVVSPTIPFTVAPGDQIPMTLRFTLMNRGPQRGVLTLTSNDPEKPTLTVSLSGDEACRTVTTGEFREASGRTIAVPIGLSDASDIAVLRLTLMYDPTILSIADRQAVSRGTLLPGDFSLNVNIAPAGQLTLLIAPPLRSPLPTLPSQGGTVAVVTFEVLSSARDRATTPLRFTTASAASPNGVPLEICTQDGRFTVRNVLPGDVTRDGVINEQDLLRLIAHLTGEDPLTGLALEAADTNCDRMVNEVDLIFLIQHLTGEKPLPESCPPQTEVTAANLQDERRIRLGEIAFAERELHLPILLDDADAIAALRLRITFDPDIIHRVSVERGDLIPGEFTLVVGSPKEGEMTILILPPLGSPVARLRSGSGRVVTLRVTPRQDRTPHEALSAVTVVALGAADVFGREIPLRSRVGH